MVGQDPSDSSSSGSFGRSTRVELSMEGRREEVGLATQAAVEPFKSGAGRPWFERTGEAHFPRCEFVALAEHRSAVTIQLQDLGQA